MRNGQIKANIVDTQSRRLKRAVEECTVFFCDSHATMEDARNVLGIPAASLKVVYPGFIS